MDRITAGRPRAAPHDGRWHGVRLHGQATREQLGTLLGLPKAPPMNTPAHSLRRLQAGNIVTKLAHGEYRFEDEAFGQRIREQGTLGDDAPV